MTDAAVDENSSIRGFTLDRTASLLTLEQHHSEQSEPGVGELRA